MITFTVGDICRTTADVIVNPSNTHLSGSGGVDRAIHRKAGPELDKACKAIGYCPVGTAVLTEGYQMDAGHIVHTAVPQWRADSPVSEYLLAACYAASLELAATTAPKSIAFVAMGTGAMGFFPERAARVAVRTAWQWLDSRKDHKPEILFVLAKEELRELFARELLLQVSRSFRSVCSPESLACLLKESLPVFFEERGGLVKLPPEKDILLRKYRDSFYDLHSAYSRYMLLLYNTIGSPDYNQVLLSGLKRSGLSGNPEAFFSRMLSHATVEECICYLVYLQRMDYASGGTSHNHLKACASGEVVRVLEHMDALLSKPVPIG